MISADALWEEGFRAIFPELWGEAGFDEVAQTLDLIETLPVELVIPGHGASFQDITKALATAQSRLDYLASDPDRNARQGAKVLLKYRLLEWCRKNTQEVNEWIAKTPALISVAKLLNMNMGEFIAWLPKSLMKSGAAKLEGDILLDA